uniref:Uncharacterized protein n=1 Tax=Accipiter nisus TaxID=211598 RepID=A0A8B9N4Q7_9AVES
RSENKLAVLQLPGMFLFLQSDQQLDCALDLMRRLPPQQIEKNLSDLIDLVMDVLWHFKDVRDTICQNTGVLENTQIYNLCYIRYAAVQQISKKNPWPTILCPMPVFRLPLKHLFSFCKLLVKKTNLKRMCVLVTSCIGFSCTSCVAQLGYNRLASVNCPLKQCVAWLPLE